MPSRPRVAVVFGGRSSEHAVSCVTAGSVLAALDRDRYDVLPVGITPDGRWVLAPDEPERLAVRGGVMPRVDPSGAELVIAADPARRAPIVLDGGPAGSGLGDVDVVLPLLHGPYGEDGTLQGLLELAGVPYVGSGVLASAAAMDKDVMKRLLVSAGLPVGRYVTLRPGEWERDEARATARAEELGWPVFVKPARGGSSIGISRVDGPDGLPAAVAEAARWDPRVVVEAGVDGREVECGVLARLDGGSPDTSLPAEVVVRGGGFYDFQAKYLDGATDLRVPAELDDVTVKEVQRLSVAAFEALGCEGLARVDFFLRPDGTLLVNELNTMPGFTPTSMYPRMWAASGVAYGQLLDRLLQLALARPTGLR